MTSLTHSERPLRAALLALRSALSGDGEDLAPTRPQVLATLRLQAAACVLLLIGLILSPTMGTAALFATGLGLLVPLLLASRDRLPEEAARPGSLSMAGLYDWVRAHPHDLLLGSGFRLTPLHTRRLQQLLSGPGLTPLPGGHGSSDLHRLEADNQRQLTMPLRDLTGHTLIMGTVGSGKTRLLALLACQAVLRHDTVFVIDPKGDLDLLLALREAARLSGREGDLIEIDLSSHDNRFGLNPLSTYRHLTEIGSRLGDLMPSSGGAEAFRRYAEEAITAAAAALRLRGEEITLLALRDTLLDEEAFRDAAYRRLLALTRALDQDPATDYWLRICSRPTRAKKGEDSDGEPQEGTTKAREAQIKARAIHAATWRCAQKPAMAQLRDYYRWLVAQGLTDADPDLELLFPQGVVDRSYYLKVTAAVRPMLAALTAGCLHDLLSPREKVAASADYCAHLRSIVHIRLWNLVDATVGSQVGRLMVADLAAQAGRRLLRNDTADRVSVFIDEASEVACESLVQLLNKSRASNFAVTLATQTFADLEKRCGSRAAAQQVLGNCNAKVALRLMERESAELISSDLPETEVATRSSSLGTSGDALGALRHSAARGIAMRPAPLFPTCAYSMLPDLEYVAHLPSGEALKGILPFVGGSEGRAA
ncbi:MAG: type IV secretion system DNA-binding domain-containing protein [Succinivibrionaceae bacterium]|nr:type IV secretion system DNA-binding domain-containing protein [Succinivibrionaceae bacterium]